MLPTFSPWGTIAYFHINRDYIAKVWCENQSRPQLNCNGKCFLAKKLKLQQDKKDKETSERIENVPLLQLYSTALIVFDIPLVSFIERYTPIFYYKTSWYYSFLKTPFQPPRS